MSLIAPLSPAGAVFRPRLVSLGRVLAVAALLIGLGLYAAMIFELAPESAPAVSPTATIHLPA